MVQVDPQTPPLAVSPCSGHRLVGAGFDYTRRHFVHFSVHCAMESPVGRPLRLGAGCGAGRESGCALFPIRRKAYLLSSQTLH